MDEIPPFSPEFASAVALCFASSVPMWLEGIFLTRGSLFLDPVAVEAGTIAHDLPPGSLHIPHHLPMRCEVRPAVLRSDGTIAFWPARGRMVGQRGGPIEALSGVGVTMSGVLAVLPDGRIEVTRRWHATPLILVLTAGLAPYLAMGPLSWESLLCMLLLIPGVPLVFYFAVLWWNYRQLEVVMWYLLDELRAPRW